MRLPEDISAATPDLVDPLALAESDLADVLETVSPQFQAQQALEAELLASHDAEQCVALACRAEELEWGELKRRCLEQAIALDRHCQSALLMLAAVGMDEGDASTTFALLEETARAGLLPENVAPLHRDLVAAATEDARLEGYLRLIGRIAEEKPAKTLSIVLITNLFPPQELGGYGRMMWEFAYGLIERGHSVRVLTSDTPTLAKAPTADETVLEQHVFRTLQLAGTWVGGRSVPIQDRNEVIRRMRDNASRIRNAVTKQKADLVLAGNLDFLGVSALRPALEKNIPTLHALANAGPGFSVADQPTEAHYWVAPCSDWNGAVFQRAGYTQARIETLYPGARVDRFFRLFLPDTRRLRICYASLVLPYKGADTFVQALVRLDDAGVEFTAEIAGDAPDASFLATLQEVIRSRGLEAKVKFTGFLDRHGLAALFARSNVLVFPSRFEEPFGISQVEALAAGLVVVSSGTGGAKEIIRDSIDGLLFQAGDSEELAAKLLGLSRNAAAMARLQRNGQARATTFSVANAVRKIETLATEMQAAKAVVTPEAMNEIDVAEGRKYFNERNFSAALAKGCAALKANPNSAPAHLLLGEIALQRPGGAAQALELFQSASKFCPSDIQIEVLIARASIALGELSKADSILAQLIERAPGDCRVLLTLADLREAQGRTGDAVGVLNEALRISSDSHLRMRLGHALKKCGRNREALVAYRESFDIKMPVDVADPRTRRVRVAFLVQFPQGWTSTRSTYHAFAADPRFDATVIACPFFHENPLEGGAEAIYAFLEKEGVPFSRWNDVKWTPGLADVMFVQIPYDSTRPAPLHLASLLRVVPRLAYIPYALEVCGGDAHDRLMMDLPLHRIAWLVCARSERQRAAFGRICRSGNSHVVVTGHAKLDALRELGSADTSELDRFAAGRKLVAWNPHFDMVPKNGSAYGTGLSTFLRWADFVLAEFERRPDLALVIRPHPLFFGKLEAQRIWTKPQIERFFARIESSGNIQIDRDPSYLPLFARADAMMSDASSFVLEFNATGKPVLFLHNPDGPALNDAGEFVRSALYTATSEEQMLRFLDQVRTGDDPLRQVRHAHFPEFLHLPPEGSGVAVKQAVLDRLIADADTLSIPSTSIS